MAATMGFTMSILETSCLSSSEAMHNNKSSKRGYFYSHESLCHLQLTKLSNLSIIFKERYALIMLSGCFLRIHKATSRAPSCTALVALDDTKQEKNVRNAREQK